MENTITIQDLINDEIEAIEGYKKAIKETNDPLEQDVYKGIIEDEEKHIKLLKSLIY